MECSDFATWSMAEEAAERTFTMVEDWATLIIEFKIESREVAAAAKGGVAWGQGGRGRWGT